MNYKTRKILLEFRIYSYNFVFNFSFLRSQKEYIPPNDIHNKLNGIFTTCLGSTELSSNIDSKKKFELLSSCFKEFNHGVPNSLLHTINTLKDIKLFYETPVNVTVPYDKLKDMELPKNLHVQYEYHRFHPGIIM